MYKIYADYKRVFSNQLHEHLGNKLLHLFYLITLCDKTNRKPVVFSGSNLDKLFEYLTTMEVLAKGQDTELLFVEQSCYLEPNRFERILKIKKNQSLIDLGVRSYKQFLTEYEFLNSSLPNIDFAIRGHFWHSNLMPTKEVFERYFKIKQELIDFVLNQYPGINTNTAVSVHYRGGDFHHHKEDIFKKKIALDMSYYKKAKRIIKEKYDNITFHIFSDELERILPIFEEENIVIHKDDAFTDWVGLYLSKNVIQSNSSFCWTAALFNDGTSIQPKYGHGYNDKKCSVPYGFIHENSIIID